MICYISRNFYLRKSRITQKLFCLAGIGVRLWNGIPEEFCEVGKAPFKCKLTKLLSEEILRNEKINVDICYTEISKYPSIFNKYFLSN